VVVDGIVEMVETEKPLIYNSLVQQLQRQLDQAEEQKLTVTAADEIRYL
jgi:hypothetical protein